MTRAANHASLFEEWAHRQGVSRPFDALANMPAEARIQIATELAIDLRDAVSEAHTHATRDIDIQGGELPLPPKALLTAQAEACLIIGKNVKGIQARAHAAFRKLNPLATNYTWRQILVSVVKEMRIPVGPVESSSENELEAAICQHVARRIPDDLPQDRARGLRDRVLRWIDTWLPRQDASSTRLAVAGLLKLTVRGGFRTYVRAVKVAARLNRLPFVKVPMRVVTYGLKRFLIAVDAMLSVLLLFELVDMVFGPSRARLLTPIVLIHQYYVERDSGAA